MNEKRTVLAFDFGASSGRAIRAVYDGASLVCEEVHRFENTPVECDGHLCWDFPALMQNVHQAIEAAGSFESIGFDSWGVDFGLLDSQGVLLQNPVHYRDGRTAGMVEAAEKIMPLDELYQHTGNQIMPINTLFQIMALQKQSPRLLEQAKTLLWIPDLFAYSLCGQAVSERSIASTGQILDPRTGDWSGAVCDAYSVPKKLLAPLVSSGTVIGEYRGARVISVAGHDTQCASAAIPSNDSGVAFLSCGTWSLLGVELDAPVLTAKSRTLGLSNELGANGKINYLKNIIGLWLIQEARREWKRQGEAYSYAQLEELALSAKPLQSFIDPDAPEFVPPGDIPSRVQAFCRKTGQPVPETVGEIMRCIYESLAMKYRFAVEQLQLVTGSKFKRLHVLGGGSKDNLLCRMTAESCGMPVQAGPTEATALGNIIIQLVALGALPDIAAGRELIAATQTVTEYLPQGDAAWESAWHNFQKIL